MNLNEIAIFIKVVEQGSFIAAAKLLEMPKSTVSLRLSSLEMRLGVTLIRRTTRKLHVTDAGRAYYEQCQLALSQIMAAEETVTQSQVTPNGLLKITAPIELGGALLPLVVEEFSKRYPQVRVEIKLSDHSLELVAAGIDLAIRAGSLKDSSLIAKRLGTIYFAPFASQNYLKKKGVPKTPQELSAHSTIPFSSLGSDEWTLQAKKEKHTVKLENKMVINDLNLIKSLTISGLGIALIPTFLCYQEVKSGKLVRVLDNWRSEVKPVHLIYPSQRFVTPKIKAFIEVAKEIIKKHLATSEL